tara:strand:+ start:196 stop:396 length:201 start_codon:yes stop_codon:yes gene_type:complete
MAWHIKKTSMMGAGVGEVYYAGSNRWTETYADRKTYTSQAKAKAEGYIWEKKTTAGWDLVAINENA